MTGFAEASDLLVHSAGTARAPMTWAQRAMLRTVLALGDGSGYFTLARVVRPSRTLPVTAARRAVARLVARHQTLRTVFHRVPGGYEQVVEPEVRIPVVGSPSATAAVVALRRHPWNPWQDSAVRVALVGDSGGVEAVALGVSHLAVDAGAMDLLAADLAAELAAEVDGAQGGPPVAAPAWQPVDQAGFEASQLARRTSEQAVSRWARMLEHAAEDAPPPTAGAEDRFQEWRLECPAVRAAAETVAARTGTSTASAVLAAWCRVLADVGGRTDRTLVTVIAGNRYRPRERRFVGPLVQDGLFGLDRPSADLDQLVRQVHLAALTAYSTARYDPDDLASALPAGGGKIRTFFNFASRQADAAVAPGDSTGEPVRSGQWPYLDLSRFLLAQPLGASVLSLRLTVDTSAPDQQSPPDLLLAVRDALFAFSRRTAGVSRRPRHLPSGGSR